MFSAILEARPRVGQWDAFLDKARLLRPELEQLPGFIDTSFYRSLTREGWMLSLTGLRDEQAMLRWRRLAGKGEGQGEGGDWLVDRRLRAGLVAFDTRIPDGGGTLDPRLEEMEKGERPAITLIDGLQWPDWVNSSNAEEVALYLGFDPYSYGDCISWDVFDSIFSPGAIILLTSWKGFAPALDFAQSAMVPDDARVRAVGDVRDYGVEGLEPVAGPPGSARDEGGPGTIEGPANDR